MIIENVSLLNELPVLTLRIKYSYDLQHGKDVIYIKRKKIPSISPFILSCTAHKLVTFSEARLVHQPHCRIRKIETWEIRFYKYNLASKPRSLSPVVFCYISKELYMSLIRDIELEEILNDK